MKRVLITAGPVYGPLDANKLVSNRTRGIWATAFAIDFQTQDRGYDTDTTLLLPDLTPKSEVRRLEDLGIDVQLHHGYDEYRAKCLDIASRVDAAVMAAAVVNWIPAEPFPGKMPTEGYKPGDIIQIPFKLAPRVIEEMRTVNPKMTLIGCKLLAGVPQDALVEAAYHVIEHARCHAVVANDLTDLRHKLIVHPDGTLLPFAIPERESPRAFYDHLRAMIEDEHYATEYRGDYSDVLELAENRTAAYALFNRVVEKYRDRFNVTVGGRHKVFGSIAVRIAGTDTVLMTAREKHDGWESVNPVVVTRVRREDRKVWVGGTTKATLNAPLLYQMCVGRKARVVLHLHEQLPGVPTQGYAPAGTVRDTERDIKSGPAFNIEGHGFVAVLDPETLEILT